MYVVLRQRLQAGEVLNEPLRQPERHPWVAAHQTLRHYLTRLPQRLRVYQPRVGELVLYYRHVAGEVRWDQASQRFRFWDEAGSRFDGEPEWIAGVVAQGPEEKQAFSVEDLQRLREVPESRTAGPELEREQKWTPQVNDDVRARVLARRGYKVEWYPDPTSDDKDYSWRSAYVPLHHIRPFRYHGRVLQSVPRDSWHPTITHANKAMATCALTDQYHVRGRWPEAEVTCRGVWVGSELLVLGDTVHYLIRLSGSTHLKMMVLEAITFSRTYSHDGNPGRAEIRFEGKTQAGETVTVMLDNIIGRRYGEGRRVWFPNDKLGAEVDDVKSARRRSAQEDTRRKNGTPWYLANDRIEQLGLTRFHSRMVDRASTTSR